MGETAEEIEFAEFYRAYWPRLVAALALALPPDEEPEDVAQEAFARAYQNWRRVHALDRPDSWLFVTAYRIATGLRRRAVLKRSKVGSAPSTPSPDLLEAYSLSESLKALVPRQQAALLLRHYYGLSIRETAHVLGCRDGTVKSLVARGTQALRLREEKEETA